MDSESLESNDVTFGCIFLETDITDCFDKILLLYLLVGTYRTLGEMGERLKLSQVFQRYRSAPKRFEVNKFVLQLNEYSKKSFNGHYPLKHYIH